MRRSVALLLTLGLAVAACDGGGEGGEIATDDTATASTSTVSTTTAPTTTDAPSAPTTGGVTSTVPSTTSPDDVATPTWAECEDEDGLECATLGVPLDHDDPDGPAIELALARRPAGDPDERIGSLVLNPGGPGGSGVEFVAIAALTFPRTVTDRFDLVGFDPRGVGASSAVDCDLQLDDGIELIADDDRAAWDALLERTEADLATCTTPVDGLAERVGTNAAARDLDLIRAAVGDDQLTYVGFSYGTRLGATYAELFPERVRALVLDGAVAPSTDVDLLGEQQAAGFDQAFERFAAACDADADCLLAELGPTVDVVDAVRSEVRELGSIDAGDDRVLTPGELDLGILSALYSRDAWPILVQGLYLAETVADGEVLQVLADSIAGRRPDGTYSNQTEAGSFINCADDPERPSADETWASADRRADESRHFADFQRAATGCLGLPDALDPLLIGPAEGAAPILVIGTTGDPATPYEWSVELADALDSGVLYSVDGDGHTAYTSIECVQPVVDAYLIDLELPGTGGSCADEIDDDVFVPPGESDFELIVEFFACVREEGVDIDEVTLADLLADPTGEEILAGIDLDDPAVLGAFVACQSLLPV